MELKKLPYELTICKIKSTADLSLDMEFYFLSKTDEELSLVCQTKDIPINTTNCDNGWRAFRIEGILDFSLIGILSEISTILANNKIGIFAVSTYNTDYILVKGKDFDKALSVLESSGYNVI